MNRLDARLLDVLEPVRDVAVGELLEALAHRLDAGADVLAEPQIRDPAGRIRRHGPLQLPYRGDLMVARQRRKLIERIDCETILPFEPVTLVEPGGFAAVVSPFRWDAADILIETAQSQPNWAPLRHWFLEWFQSRFSDVAPDLDGAVHSLSGPEDVAGGWRVRVDFGSAPVQCVADLIAAFAETGAARIRLGHMPTH